MICVEDITYAMARNQPVEVPCEYLGGIATHSTVQETVSGGLIHRGGRAYTLS